MDESRFGPLSALLVAAALATGSAAPAGIRAAQAQPVAPAATAIGYADLAALVDNSAFVIRAKIRGQAEVPPEQAFGVAPGNVRLYIEAEPLALLAGRMPVTEEGLVRYLVDVAPAARGRAPKLKKSLVLLFGRPVAGQPGEIQLAGPLAQQSADPAFEARLRPVLDEFFAADAPPRITGIRDVLWVPGNLTGESETQLFLRTATEQPALITVTRRPGMEPHWGVSWSELVDPEARPPAPNSLVWYRLACSLPARLPAAAQLASDPESRMRAQEDYSLVLRDLGPCNRVTR